MKCSICINTYRRPELLKKLLHSLDNQKLDIDLVLEIIVVDNDNNQLGKKVVDDFRPNSKFEIKYFVQLLKNISLTRNKAVSEASGEYLFFIDDDEYAKVDWIINSLECCFKYQADAVFGKVISYFEDNTPDLIKSNSLFNRKYETTGERPRFTRTGNCLIKAQWLKMIEGPFDPEYGTTGGEDSHLFEALSIKGAKFVFCEESVVYEFIPRDRANIKWLIFRSLRTGNSYARRAIQLSKNTFIKRMYLLIKAIFLAIVNSTLAILSFYSVKKSFSYFIKTIGYCGHILAVFDVYYKEYK